MNKIICFFVLSILISLISCRKENSEKIDQNEIWSEYSLIYRSDINSTFARARFLHQDNQGQNIKLSNKSSIRINDEIPYYNNTFAWYEKIISGKESVVDFYYSDLDGKEYKNKVEILGGAELPEIDSIYKDSLYYFPWEGDSLQDGEMVLLFIDGNLKNKLPYVLIDSVGKNGIFIEPDSLSALAVGDVTIHFERFNIQEANSALDDLEHYSHYISRKKVVKLVVN